MNINHLFTAIILAISAITLEASDLEETFCTPPDKARPGVYWYFMDGNMDRKMMEVDLHSMHKAGLRKALFLEVNIGVSRGPVDYMSETWQDNFANAAKVADQLGIEIILGTGLGWGGGLWRTMGETRAVDATPLCQLRTDQGTWTSQGKTADSRAAATVEICRPFWRLDYSMQRMVRRRGGLDLPNSNAYSGTGQVGCGGVAKNGSVFYLERHSD